MGGSANVNSAEIYNGQKAGYGTGGGVTVRNRVMNSKYATVQLPAFDAGCGGIDIYAGGFSFIDSTQLIETLKSIGASSTGYAFLLGLETVSPQIANTIRQLQSWANTINSTGINSCETAAQLVGSVWPKNEMASQHICRSMGGHEGQFKSYISARHQCSNKKTSQESRRNVAEKNPDLLYEEYNIAWRAIQKDAFLAANLELADLIMTIMGTIVVREVEDHKQISRYASKVDDEGFLSKILEGGSASIYTCADRKQCLSVTTKDYIIPYQESWTGKIQKQLENIQQKIWDDEELEIAERTLLAKSRLPLYKIVGIMTAYKKGISPIDLYQIADIVAMDMLSQFLKEALDSVREGAQILRMSQEFSSDIDEYIHDLDRIRRSIQYYETRSMQMMEREMQILQKMQLIEDQIASELFLL